MKDYEKYVIKVYKHWRLYLHEDQYPYLGRCYAWAVRENARELSDISKEERRELFEDIIPQWTTAVKKLFNADWINVAILGNSTPHAHWHLVPRYHTDREYQKIVFCDPNPSKNYSPYQKRKLPEKVIKQIRNDLIMTL